jgi:hypothetical protein
MAAFPASLKSSFGFAGSWSASSVSGASAAIFGASCFTLASKRVSSATCRVSSTRRASRAVARDSQGRGRLHGSAARGKLRLTMRASLSFALLALFSCGKEADPANRTPTPAAAPKVEPAAVPADAPARVPEPAAGAPPASAPPIAGEQGGTIAGVRWGEPPAAKDLPDTPVAADIAGAATPIVHVVAARMPDFPDSPLFLDLFVSEPPDTCALHIGMGAATPSFSFALGVAPNRGAVVEYHGTSELDAKPPVYARFTVRSAETGHIRTFGDADAILVIDAIDAKGVKGRVYAAFRDPGKALVVGAFEAPICADADVK